MMRIFRAVVILLCVLCLFSTLTTVAQTTALPYTMTTAAGLSPMSNVAGTQCPNLPTGVKSTDAFGDGCLAVNGIFGASGSVYGSIRIDPFGNVFVSDDANSVIHMINPSTGIMTRVAGAGTACGAKQDASGDGCPALQTVNVGAERGLGIDPYGNIITPGYKDNLVHIICRTASPLCGAGTGQTPIGNMGLIAGCSAGTGSNGTTGSGLDAVPAKTTSAGTCSTALGEVNQPRGATADMYGNVYFADTASFRYRVVLGPQTSSYFSGSNPLYAILTSHYGAVTQGFAYTIAGFGTATTIGQTCGSSTAIDTIGDGCPFNFSSVLGSSGYIQGIAVDAVGNLIFTDPGEASPNASLRVLLVSTSGTAGQAMLHAIQTNNPSVSSVQVGSIYGLAGMGSTPYSPLPILGKNAKTLGTTAIIVTVSPQGDIYIGNKSNVYMLDMHTGYIRQLLVSNANVTAGNNCPGTSGQKSLSAYSDGCAASGAVFTNSNALGLSADAQNNLYLYDGTSASTMLVRKVLAQGFVPQQTIGTPLVQTFGVHLPQSVTGSVSGATASVSAVTSGVITTTTPVCNTPQNVDNSIDCYVTVTTTPTTTGLQKATLNVTLPSGTAWTNPSVSIALSGIVNGSVLALDNAALTTTSGSTPIAPTVNTISDSSTNSIIPAGVATDGQGNIYMVDAATGSIMESIQGAAPIAIVSGIFSQSAKIAIDALGNIFVVDAGTHAIQEFAVSGPATTANGPLTYTPQTISYTPASGTANPQAIAVDVAGNLYVADNQGSGSSAVYKIALAPNGPTQSTFATGLGSPAGLAVDNAGNVYVGDTSVNQVVKLSPNNPGSMSNPNTLNDDGLTAGTQTAVITGVTPAGIAIDAAGDVYVQDAASNSIVMLPASGSIQTPVTLLSTLHTPSGLAVDGAGNVYSADSGSGLLLQFVRHGATYNLPDANTSLTGVLTNVGNLSATIANTNTTNFNIPTTGTNACNTTAAVGSACNLTAKYVSGANTVTDIISFTPAATSIGTLTLGVLPQAIATTTTVSQLTPANPTTASGATLTITVTPASGAISTSDTVTVHVVGPLGTTPSTLTLSTAGTGGAASTTLNLPSLAAGNYSVDASYAGNSTYGASSTASATQFTVTTPTTTTIAGPTPASPVAGTSTSFTITVAPTSGSVTPTGTVTISLLDNTTSTTTSASGTLAANGTYTANYTTLAADSYTITASYAGSSSFAASSTSAGINFTVAAPTNPTTTTMTLNNSSITYGGAITGNVTVTSNAGAGTPGGIITLLVGSTQYGTCTLVSGTCTFSLASLPAGVQTLTANYDGSDGINSPSGSTGATINVARAILQITANNYTVAVGAPLPAYGASYSGFIGSDTVSVLSGSPAITASVANTSTVGIYPISITTGTLASTNYTFAFTPGYVYVVPGVQSPAVATGDTRTVTEPSFPSVCQQLTATIASVNDDIPSSVDYDAAHSNPDGARIQAALNYCSQNYPGQAVQLSMDGAGNSAFLSGGLMMPSNVTLLVDPGVVLFFSRNVQDYDKVAGTHTCGTIGTPTSTASCNALIEIPATSTNVGIMGYGKLDGRGGDTLFNTFPSSYAGQSWWGLSNIANGVGNQQNPRFIQMDSGASNVTLYKITVRNSPLFHVSSTGRVSNVTVWDIKVITPTSSRNTDGVDPGNVNNFTLTRSWVSDGDDNVAVGASGLGASNISITNNHFFAGHGESIGSYTGGGVANVLYDGNMLSGNSSVDSNSTSIRIKSANDRGGLVTGIQYSNSCFQNHKAEIQFTPLYNTNSGTQTPNFTNILMQNLLFKTAGTVQFTGAANGSTVNPLLVTMDNVTFSNIGTSNFTTTGTAGTETNAQLTYGPGMVSNNFTSAWATFAGSNGNTAINNITASTAYPPACDFTAIAAELTGPTGLPQTITQGQNATLVVMMTPAVGGSAYPTGNVTITDAFDGSTTTVPMPGNSDTVFVPVSNLQPGVHTFTASYAGDVNYVPAVSGNPYTTSGSYVVTVNAGTLPSTTAALSLSSSTTSYGMPVTATATITGGTNPTGTVAFVVDGTTSYAASAVNASGVATVSLNLPYRATPYSITAVYSGDLANAGSTSAVSPLTVGLAVTTITSTPDSATTTLGHAVTFTTTVASAAGMPTGTVLFSYTSSGNPTPTTVASAILTNGVATTAVNLPMGINSVTATFVPTGSFAASAATPVSIEVDMPAIVPLPSDPIALPYTISTIAGGAAQTTVNSSACTGADTYGNGCLATLITLYNASSAQDLRAVTADPFGNVYFTDVSAGEIRRIAPNGIVTDFAGWISGTTCVPTATSGCAPTTTKLSKTRGVYADAAGNVYIAAYSNNLVYKVSVTDGKIYLLAGGGTPSSGIGDGGPATAASLSQPRGIGVDVDGNIYIADTGNYRIRKVNTGGYIQTIAGTGTNATAGDGGPATSATLSTSQDVKIDANMNIYIADSASVRVVCVTCGSGSPLDHLLNAVGVSSPVNGNIYKLAGGGATTYPTSPVLPTSVSMSPQKLAFDRSGNLYISDNNNLIWFLDGHTGYIRPIAGNRTGSAGVPVTCAGQTNTVGDGCQATLANAGSGTSSGVGVGSDTLGNIYISDSTNLRIRKVSTNLQSPATAVGSTATKTVVLHFIAGDTIASGNGLAYSSNEWSLSSPSCVTNADSSADCTVSTSSFTPAAPGVRSTPLTVNSTLGNVGYLSLNGIGLGSSATLDPATQVTFGTNLQIVGMATDRAGNIYASDTSSNQLLKFTAASVAQGSGATPTVLATLGAAGAVAVDGRGFVYAADTSNGTVLQVSPTGVTATLPFTFSTPAGLAVDSQNNLYVSDSSAQTIYQIDPIVNAERVLATGSFTAPAGLAMDPAGNLLITDPGAGAIYRLNVVTRAMTTVSSSASAPFAIAADAAGNLLVADTASILAVPASANSAAFTVATITSSAMAMDSTGNLYVGSAGSITQLQRTQGHVQFADASASPQAVNLMESGNQLLSISAVSQTDTTDYGLTATTTTDCIVSSALPTSLAVGGVCAISAAYTPTTYNTTTDTATFNGNAVPVPQLVLTGPATPPASTTTMSALSPTSPAYGDTITAGVAVTGNGPAPQGTVVFTVDSTTVNGTLAANGTASVTLPALSTGTHTISVAYTSTNGYANSSSASASFTITQATPTVTVTASSTSPTYGTPITVTVSVPTDATGSVSFYDGSTLLGTTNVSSGSASLQVSLPSAGNQSITATYSGDTNYGQVTSTPLSLTVAKETPSSIVVTATPNPPTADAPVILSVAVPTDATGTVSLYDGPTLLGTATISNGVATLTTTITTAGSNSITAGYSGDSNYNSATSAPLTLSVSKATPTVPAPTITPNPVTAGGQVTMSVTLPSDATGTVSFYDGATLLGTATVSNGVATLTTTITTAGSHSITVGYSGDNNYNNATSATTTLSVSKATPTVSSLTVTPNPPTAGGQVTLSETVPSNATGTVSFYDGANLLGTATISNGVATLTTTLATAGSHSITAGYSGDTNYNSATSAPVAVAVTAATPTLSVITATPNPPSAGGQVALSITVPSNATGTVSFYDGATLLGTATVSNGVATLTTTLATAGNHSISATYSGDTHYGSATSATLSLTVSAAVATDFAITATSPAQTIQASGTATYSITVSGVNGSFANPVALSVSGLPPGATYAFTQATVTPGSSGATTTLTITVPRQSASTTAPGIASKAPLALALLLLPLAALRKNRRSLLMCVLFVLAIAGAATGCGGKHSSATTSQSYSVTVMGTSGSITHSTVVSLTVTN